MDDFTLDDMQKAMGAFLICFGQGLPATLKESIRQRTHELADRIEHGGEPTVAMLAKGFADALAGANLPPPKH